MQIGFYTSTFNDRPIEEVLDFAKASGFDAIEIDVGGHIKSPDNVGSVVKAARDHGLRVSSIAFFGNQLDPDAAKRRGTPKADGRLRGRRRGGRSSDSGYLSGARPDSIRGGKL